MSCDKQVMWPKDQKRNIGFFLVSNLKRTGWFLTAKGWDEWSLGNSSSTKPIYCIGVSLKEDRTLEKE